MLGRKLLVAGITPHLSDCVMEFLPMTAQAGLGFLAHAGELARLLDIAVKQFNDLGCNLSRQPTTTLFPFGTACLIARQLAPIAHGCMTQNGPETDFGIVKASLSTLGQ
jgi:hypothetical protein